jgi:hypothetical protein
MDFIIESMQLIKTDQVIVWATFHESGEVAVVDTGSFQEV